MHILYFILIFLAPALWFFFPAKFMRHPRLGMLAGAALSLLGGMLLVTQAPLWTEEGRRLAWRSFTVKGDESTLGGSKEESVVGWPSGEFLPELSVGKSAIGAEIRVRGGGGFAAIEVGSEQSEVKRQFINGQELPADAALHAWGGYQLEVVEEQRFFLLRPFMGSILHIRLCDAAGREIVTFNEVRPRHGKRPRVMPLVEGLEIKAGRIHQQNDISIPEMLKVREWMHGRLLLMPDSGPLRLASLSDQRVVRQVPELEPGKTVGVVLFGLGSRVERVLLEKGGSLAVPSWKFEFQQPFKLSSPLPPSPASLVVTGRPLPGDQAFLLPVGQAGRQLRGKLPMQKGEAGGWSFNTHAAEDDPVVPGIFTPKNKPVETQSVEDRKEVALSAGISAEIALVNDFPTVWSLIIPGLLVLIILVLLVAGITQDEEEAEARHSWWAVLGVALFLWAILILRWVLAMRYALDPGRVDKYAVQTVSECWLALAWAPFAVLLCARFMRPEAARAGTLLLNLIGAFVLSAILWWRVSLLWPSFIIELPWDKLGMLALLMAVMWRFVPQVLTSNATKLWHDLHRSGGRGFGLLLVIFVLLAGAIALICHVATLLPVISEPLQEIVGPFVLWWFVAWIWLSSLVADWEAMDDDDSSTRWKFWLRALCCGFVFVLVPLALVSFSFRDFGVLVAGLTLFGPLGMLLFASAWVTRRPRRYGVAVLTMVVVMVGLSFALLLLPVVRPGQDNMVYRLAAKLTGEADVRLGSWLKEDRQEWDYLFSDALPAGDESEGRGLASFKVLNSVQHRWESRAITYAAGWFGQGLGTAPVRRSQTPAHTLQMDSVFTHYILGDYGLAGGAVLLLAMLLPLGIFLRSARHGFDLGHGLAVLIGSSLALEAVIHAMMNLGFLPFTGRNFPLLAAGSNTDVLRWTFLLALASMAMHRRHHPRLIDDEELISPSPARRSPQGESLSTTWQHWLAIALWPLLLIGICVWQTRTKILANAEYSEPRHWKRLGEGIQKLIAANQLKLDEQTLDLILNEEMFNNMGDRIVIRQEVQRFNQLSREEKLLEPPRRSLPDETSLIANPDSYQDLMDQMRRQSSKSQRRPCLFALTPRQEPQSDENEVEAETGGSYDVILHPAFATGMSFDPTPKPSGLPDVKWADGKTPLIGPAWINGVWRSATQMDSPLSWVGPLSAALEREWLDDGRHLGSKASLERYGRLTLDLAWQKRLQEFTAKKGRDLHATLIRALTPSSRNLPEHHLVRRLPPRIAISLMDLRDGQVIGLGSWPRMTSESFWTRGPEDREWLPPSSWLERQAPRSLRLRYGQEQNFAPFIMGSTTKPLFAAIALELHPFINNELLTRSSNANQSSVFGIPIRGPSWHTFEADGGWYNFSKFLTRSVNHYHVALGFLCLAEGNDSNILVVPGGSQSQDETFSPRTLAPWSQVPRFENCVGFSAAQPDILENLNQTRFASALRSHFPLAIQDGQLLRTARSFWTGDENHDIPESGSSRANTAAPLAEWSPAQANFAFDSSPQGMLANPDTINTPRKFVSFLLGGGSNNWSNIQFSSAFATVIKGSPLVAKITASESRTKRIPLTMSKEENTPAALHPGLAGVIDQREGTAFNHLSNGKNVIASLERSGIKAYAKTGTLAALEGQRVSSRFIIALVQWDDEDKGSVKKGLVFSAYGEKAGMSTSAQWIGELIGENYSAIYEYFQITPKAIPIK